MGNVKKHNSRSNFKRDFYLGEGSNYKFLPGGYRFLRRAFIWKSKIKRIKKHVREGRVLDVGCAYGYFLYFLKDDFEVHGCDISFHAINMCRALFKGACNEDDFIVHDIQSPLPFPKGYFDVIICHDVLEHVPGILKAVKNIHECLRDGGILFLRIPIKTRYKATEKLRFDTDPTHVSIMPEGALMKMLKLMGFVLLEKHYTWMGAFPLPRFLHFGSDVNLILKKG
ncbi:MAG: class I SAM-dependent methyltransferase [Promethearchaeota archaeon]